MKLPRWLMTLMLTSSVLLPLAAAGWWWVTWPERTAREFVELIGRDAVEQISGLLESRDGAARRFRIVHIEREDWVQSNLIPEPRTVADFCLGRQSFLVRRTPILDGMGPYEFRVERGRVVRHVLQSGWSGDEDPSIIEFDSP